MFDERVQQIRESVDQLVQTIKQADDSVAVLDNRFDKMIESASTIREVIAAVEVFNQAIQSLDTNRLDGVQAMLDKLAKDLNALDSQKLTDVAQALELQQKIIRDLESSQARLGAELERISGVFTVIKGKAQSLATVLALSDDETKNFARSIDELTSNTESINRFADSLDRLNVSAMKVDAAKWGDVGQAFRVMSRSLKDLDASKIEALSKLGSVNITMSSNVGRPRKQTSSAVEPTQSETLTSGEQAVDSAADAARAQEELKRAQYQALEDQNRRAQQSARAEKARIKQMGLDRGVAAEAFFSVGTDVASKTDAATMRSLTPEDRRSTVVDLASSAQAGTSVGMQLQGSFDSFVDRLNRVIVDTQGKSTREISQAVTAEFTELDKRGVEKLTAVARDRSSPFATSQGFAQQAKDVGAAIKSAKEAATKLKEYKDSLPDRSSVESDVSAASGLRAMSANVREMGSESTPGGQGLFAKLSTALRSLADIPSTIMSTPDKIRRAADEIKAAFASLTNALDTSRLTTAIRMAEDQTRAAVSATGNDDYVFVPQGANESDEDYERRMNEAMAEVSRRNDEKLRKIQEARAAGDADAGIDTEARAVRDRVTRQHGKADDPTFTLGNEAVGANDVVNKLRNAVTNRFQRLTQAIEGADLHDVKIVATLKEATETLLTNLNDAKDYIRTHASKIEGSYGLVAKETISYFDEMTKGVRDLLRQITLIFNRLSLAVQGTDLSTLQDDLRRASNRYTEQVIENIKRTLEGERLVGIQGDVEAHQGVQQGPDGVYYGIDTASRADKEAKEARKVRNEQVLSEALKETGVVVFASGAGGNAGSANTQLGDDLSAPVGHVGVAFLDDEGNVRTLELIPGGDTPTPNTIVTPKGSEGFTPRSGGSLIPESLYAKNNTLAAIPVRLDSETLAKFLANAAEATAQDTANYSFLTTVGENCASAVGKAVRETGLSEDLASPIAGINATTPAQVFDFFRTLNYPEKPGGSGYSDLSDEDLRSELASVSERAGTYVSDFLKKLEDFFGRAFTEEEARQLASYIAGDGNLSKSDAEAVRLKFSEVLTAAQERHGIKGGVESENMIGFDAYLKAMEKYRSSLKHELSKRASSEFTSLGSELPEAAEASRVAAEDIAASQNRDQLYSSLDKYAENLGSDLGVAPDQLDGFLSAMKSITDRIESGESFNFDELRAAKAELVKAVKQSRALEEENARKQFEEDRVTVASAATALPTTRSEVSAITTESFSEIATAKDLDVVISALDKYAKQLADSIHDAPNELRRFLSAISDAAARLRAGDTLDVDELTSSRDDLADAMFSTDEAMPDKYGYLNDGDKEAFRENAVGGFEAVGHEAASAARDFKDGADSVAKAIQSWIHSISDGYKRFTTVSSNIGAIFNSMDKFINAITKFNLGGLLDSVRPVTNMVSAAQNIMHALGMRSKGASSDRTSTVADIADGITKFFGRREAEQRVETVYAPSARTAGLNEDIKEDVRRNLARGVVGGFRQKRKFRNVGEEQQAAFDELVEKIAQGETITADDMKRLWKGAKPKKDVEAQIPEFIKEIQQEFERRAELADALMKIRAAGYDVNVPGEEPSKSSSQQQRSEPDRRSDDDDDDIAFFGDAEPPDKPKPGSGGGTPDRFHDLHPNDYIVPHRKRRREGTRETQAPGLDTLSMEEIDSMLGDIRAFHSRNAALRKAGLSGVESTEDDRLRETLATAIKAGATEEMIRVMARDIPDDVNIADFMRGKLDRQGNRIDQSGSLTASYELERQLKEANDRGIKLDIPDQQTPVISPDQRTGRSRKASVQGAAHEEQISQMLDNQGFVEVTPQQAAEGKNLPEKHYARQMPVGMTSDGSEILTDFFVKGLEGFERGLALEAKWQSSKGTADEKLVQNAHRISQDYNVPGIMVVEGGAQRKHVMQNVESQVGEGNLVALQTHDDLLRLLGSNSRDTSPSRFRSDDDPTRAAGHEAVSHKLNWLVESFEDALIEMRNRIKHLLDAGIINEDQAARMAATGTSALGRNLAGNIDPLVAQGLQAISIDDSTRERYSKVAQQKRADLEQVRTPLTQQDEGIRHLVDRDKAMESFLGELLGNPRLVSEAVPGGFASGAPKQTERYRRGIDPVVPYQANVADQVGTAGAYEPGGMDRYLTTEGVGGIVTSSLFSYLNQGLEPANALIHELTHALTNRAMRLENAQLEKDARAGKYSDNTSDLDAKLLELAHSIKDSEAYEQGVRDLDAGNLDPKAMAIMAPLRALLDNLDVSDPSYLGRIAQVLSNAGPLSQTFNQQTALGPQMSEVIKALRDSGVNTDQDVAEYVTGVKRLRENSESLISRQKSAIDNLFNMDVKKLEESRFDEHRGALEGYMTNPEYREYVMDPNEVWSNVGASAVKGGIDEEHWRAFYGDELYDATLKILADAVPELYSPEALKKAKAGFSKFAEQFGEHVYDKFHEMHNTQGLVGTYQGGPDSVEEVRAEREAQKARYEADRKAGRTYATEDGRREQAEAKSQRAESRASDSAEVDRFNRAFDTVSSASMAASERHIKGLISDYLGEDVANKMGRVAVTDAQGAQAVLNAVDPWHSTGHLRPGTSHGMHISSQNYLDADRAANRQVRATYIRSDLGARESPAGVANVALHEITHSLTEQAQMEQARRLKISAESGNRVDRTQEILNALRQNTDAFGDEEKRRQVLGAIEDRRHTKFQSGFDPDFQRWSKKLETAIEDPTSAKGIAALREIATVMSDPQLRNSKENRSIDYLVSSLDDAIRGARGGQTITDLLSSVSGTLQKEGVNRDQAFADFISGKMRMRDAGDTLYADQQRLIDRLNVHDRVRQASEGELATDSRFRDRREYTKMMGTEQGQNYFGSANEMWSYVGASAIQGGKEEEYWRKVYGDEAYDETLAILAKHVPEMYSPENLKKSREGYSKYHDEFGNVYEDTPGSGTYRTESTINSDDASIGVLNKIAAMIEDIAKWVRSIVAKIEGIFGKPDPNADPDAAAGHQSIGGGMGYLFSGLVSLLKNFEKTVGNKFSSIGSSISGFTKNVQTEASNFISGLGTVISQTVDQGVDNFKRAVQSGSDGVASVMTTASQGITAAGKHIDQTRQNIAQKLNNLGITGSMFDAAFDEAIEQYLSPLQRGALRATQRLSRKGSLGVALAEQARADPSTKHTSDLARYSVGLIGRNIVDEFAKDHTQTFSQTILQGKGVFGNFVNRLKFGIAGAAMDAIADVDPPGFNSQQMIQQRMGGRQVPSIFNVKPPQFIADFASRARTGFLTRAAGLAGEALAPRQSSADTGSIQESLNKKLAVFGDSVSPDKIDVQTYYDVEAGIMRVSAAAETMSGQMVEWQGHINEWGDTVEEQSKKATTWFGKIGEQIKENLWRIPMELLEESIEEIAFGLMQMIGQVVNLQDELKEIDYLLTSASPENTGSGEASSDFLFAAISAAGKTGNQFEEGVQTNIQNFKQLAGVQPVEDRAELSTKLSEIQLGAQTVFGITLDESLSALPSIFAQLKSGIDIPKDIATSLSDAEIEGYKAKQAIEELEGSMDMLVVAQRESGATGSDLIQVFAGLSSTAKDASLSQAELISLSAAAAVKLNAGPDETRTAIQNIMERTYGEGADDLADLGIAVKETKTDESGRTVIQNRNFLDILRDVDEARRLNPNLSKQYTQALGGQRRSGQALSLLQSVSDADRMVDTVAESKGQGSFWEVLTRKSEAFNAQLNTIQAEFALFLNQILFGSGAMDDLGKVLDRVSDGFRVISTVIKEQPDLIKQIKDTLKTVITMVIYFSTRGVNAFGVVMQSINMLIGQLRLAISSLFVLGKSGEASLTPLQKAARVTVAAMENMGAKGRVASAQVAAGAQTAAAGTTQLAASTTSAGSAATRTQAQVQGLTASMVALAGASSTAGKEMATAFLKGYSGITKFGATLKNQAKFMGSFAGSMIAPVALDLTMGGFDQDNMTNVGAGIAGGFIGMLVGGPGGSVIGYTIAKAFAEGVDLVGIGGTSGKEIESAKSKFGDLSEEQWEKLNEFSKSGQAQAILDAIGDDISLDIHRDDFFQKARSVTTTIGYWQMGPAGLRQTPDGSPVASPVNKNKDLQARLAEIDPELVDLVMNSGFSGYEELVNFLAEASKEGSDLSEEIDKLRDGVDSYGESLAESNDELENAGDHYGSIDKLIEKIAKKVEDVKEEYQQMFEVPRGTLEFGAFGTETSELNELYSGRFAAINRGEMSDDEASFYLDQYDQQKASLQNLPGVQRVMIPLAEELDQNINVDEMTQRLYELGSAGQQAFMQSIEPLVEMQQFVAEYEALTASIQELSDSIYYKGGGTPEEQAKAQEEMDMLVKQRDARLETYSIYSQYLSMVAASPNMLSKELSMIEEQNKARQKATLIKGTPAKFVMPSMTDVTGSSTDDILLALEKARAKQADIVRMFPQMAEEFSKDQFMIEADGKYRGVTGVNQQYFQESLKEIREKEKEKEKIQAPDLVELRDKSPEEVSAIVSKARALQDKAVALAPDLKEDLDKERLMIMGKNNSLLMELGLSQEYLRMAMEDNTEATEETLRGHYNLPGQYRTPTIWDYYNEGGTETGAENFRPMPGPQEGMVDIGFAKDLAERIANQPEVPGDDDEIIPNLDLLGSLIDPSAAKLGYPEPGTPDKWIQPDYIDTTNVTADDIIIGGKSIMDRLGGDEDGDGVPDFDNFDLTGLLGDSPPAKIIDAFLTRLGFGPEVEEEPKDRPPSNPNLWQEPDLHGPTGGYDWTMDPETYVRPIPASPEVITKPSDDVILSERDYWNQYTDDDLAGPGWGSAEGGAGGSWGDAEGSYNSSQGGGDFLNADEVSRRMDELESRTGASSDALNQATQDTDDFGRGARGAADAADGAGRSTGILSGLLDRFGNITSNVSNLVNTAGTAWDNSRDIASRVNSAWTSVVTGMKAGSDVDFNSALASAINSGKVAITVRIDDSRSRVSATSTSSRGSSSAKGASGTGGGWKGGSPGSRPNVS